MANRRDPHTFYFETGGGEANEESAPIITRHLKNLAIQIDGEFEANVSVQARLAPSLAFIELSSLSAPGFVFPQNDASLYDVKLEITGYVSGQVVGVIVGRTSQE